MKTRLMMLLLAGAVAGAQDTPTKGMKARELFFTPPASVKNTSGAASSASSKPASANSQPAKPAGKKTNGVASSAKTQPQTSPPGGADVTAGGYIPLGMRYSVLRRAGGRFDEVDPDTNFRSGDAIRVRVESNDAGYLYIISKGSSGNWRVLFPSPEINAGSNRVARGREYVIPSRNAFVFDEQPGEERLFLVLTRRPEADLERVIYALQAPEAGPAADDGKKMLASNSVEDSLVQRVQGKMVARDLVFEKVEDEEPGSADNKRKTGVYVVDPKATADSRLVANVSLKHR